MNEDDLLPYGEHNVRRPGQFSDVNPESVAKFTQQLSRGELRSRTFFLYGSHGLRACGVNAGPPSRLRHLMPV